MWDRGDMERINAHIDDHDLEEEVYDLAGGGVAQVESMHDAGGDSWIVYYWGSREDYDADMISASYGDAWALCTVSMAFDSYIDAAEQIEHDVKRED